MDAVALIVAATVPWAVWVLVYALRETRRLRRADEHDGPDQSRGPGPAPGFTPRDTNHEDER